MLILGFFIGVIFTVVSAIVGALLSKNTYFKLGLQKLDALSREKGQIYEPENERVEQLQENLKE